jgi:hypothetical protein
MNHESRPIQLHLSTCVILMFLAGCLMFMYLQFTNLLFVPNSPDFLSDFTFTKYAMQGTWIVLSLCTLVWTAILCEKLGPQPALVPVKAHSR